MTKRVLLIYSIFHFVACSFAHPGIGIVKDSRGNIYYTDLKQVWKLTPDGKKNVIVHGVHTHELFMDASDNLFGEHLWYNGERLDTWGHYAWCLKNNGNLVKIIEPREGFLSNYSFVRDSSGNMYWVERFTKTRFMKKDTAGLITKLAEAKLGFVGWLHATPDGTLFFTENNKLHKLTADGIFTTLTDDLEDRSPGFNLMGRNYDGYGIWTGPGNDVYIALNDSRKVNRICPEGRVQTIYYSPSFWSPCSGLTDDTGAIWILENSVTGDTRVIKINPGLQHPDKPPAAGAARKQQIIMTAGYALVLILTGYLFRWMVCRRIKNINPPAGKSA